MRGFGQSTSLSLVGWLWADILLGLFALFLAANTSASAAATQLTPGVDPKNIEISLAVDGSALLHGTAEAMVAEQGRIARAAQRALDARAPGRRVAIVLAYGVHADAATGDELARAATVAPAKEPSVSATVAALASSSPVEASAWTP